MKKATAICLVVMLAVSVQAVTINVPDDQPTIQAAIVASSDGDTIAVSAGTYNEQVTLSPGKNLTITGAGRDQVTWIAPNGGYCIYGAMSSYTGSMKYEISGFTFNCRAESTASWGAGIQINRASSGPLNLSIHDNRFIENDTKDGEHWGTSMLLCHNRFASRDVAGNGAVRVYNNIDQTLGGMTMSNSQAYDIYNNVFDGCSDAIYNGHGCPDSEGQTFGDHHIYSNIFKNASDNIHPGYLTPAIDWQYYGEGLGTHLASIIEKNTFENNDTSMRFVMETDMIYPAHKVNYNSFINNGTDIIVIGEYATTLDATKNWWGDPDPSDQVIGDVLYYPCFANAAMTVLHLPIHNTTQDIHYVTIQEAIDEAANGDCIIVGAGRHDGALVNKSVEIRGEGEAIIDYGPLHPAGLTMGFRMLAGSDGATISHLRFEVDLGIMNGDAVDSVTVDNCTFINNLQAVSNWRGSSWDINHNIITDLRTRNGGGIGIMCADYSGGVVTSNVVSHNTITGTLHVDPADGGGYCGTGIVLYADFRWGMAGAVDISDNRITKNKVALVSDTPDVVNVVGIELTDTRNDITLEPVLFDNTIGFNDLRDMIDTIVLTPENLQDINIFSRNLGEDIPSIGDGFGGPSPLAPSEGK